MTTSPFQVFTTPTLPAPPSKADRLRADLATAGYGASRVSVRAKSSSLNLTIRDSSVSCAKVKKIAHPYENYQTCAVSGEILMGGNTFVFVKYSDGVRAEVASRYGDAIQTALEKAQEWAKESGRTAGARVEGIDHPDVYFVAWVDGKNAYLTVSGHNGYRPEFLNRHSVWYDPSSPYSVTTFRADLSLTVHEILDREANKK